MQRLHTQPNLHRQIVSLETHCLSFHDMCPFSHNPQEGSYLMIAYIPQRTYLEVYALRAYVDSYRGGRGDVRDMEGMIKQIGQDCANILDTMTRVYASLKLHDASLMQKTVDCFPQYRFMETSSWLSR